jgi:hypothetical protein
VIRWRGIQKKNPCSLRSPGIFYFSALSSKLELGYGYRITSGYPLEGGTKRKSLIRSAHRVFFFWKAQTSLTFQKKKSLAFARDFLLSG